MIPGPKGHRMDACIRFYDVLALKSQYFYVLKTHGSVHGFFVSFYSQTVCVDITVQTLSVVTVTFCTCKIPKRKAKKR